MFLASFQASILIICLFVRCVGVVGGGGGEGGERTHGTREFLTKTFITVSNLIVLI